MLNKSNNSNLPTMAVDGVRNFYDDPNTEYLNSDGTAKKTSYMLAVYVKLDHDKVGVMPTLTYYAKDDFDAYVRSSEMIRKHMFCGDIALDKKFTANAVGIILKPHRVDSVDGQTVYREFRKANMPRNADPQTLMMEAA